MKLKTKVELFDVTEVKGSVAMNSHMKSETHGSLD